MIKEAKVRTFLSFLILLFLVGCSESTPDAKSKAVDEKESVISIEDSGVINLANRESYAFRGTCNSDGLGNIDYTLAGTGSDPLKGVLSCSAGAWEFPLAQFDIDLFEDGTVTLEVTHEKVTDSLEVNKDTTAPVLSRTITTNGRGTWSWSCEESSSCATYRAVMNKDSTYEFPADAPFSEASSLENKAQSNGDEDYYIHVQAQDEAGNTSDVITSNPLRFDNMAPSLESISAVSNSSRNTAWAKVGDEITLTLTFSEGVIVSGAAPQVEMNIGSASVMADFEGNFSSGVASATHSFTYTVVDENGALSATGLNLNNVLIRDSASNELIAPSFPLNISGVTVDTVLPVVTVSLDAALADSWTWSCSETCEYRHAIDEAAGTDTLTGSWNSLVGATAPGGVNTIHYVHVQAIDPAGNESAVVHGESITTTVEDTTAPTIRTVSMGAGFHVQDEKLNFTVDFSEPVTVTGSPTMTISIGSTTDIAAAFTGTAGETSVTLSFEYTVAANLEGEVQVTGFAVDGSNKIEDGAGNAVANPDSPFAVQGGSVDSTPPIISGVEDDDVPQVSKVWTWSCSEECTYQWEANDDPDFVFSDEEFTTVITHTENTEGVRYLHLRAKDAAGNLSAPLKVYVTILDSTRPRVTEVVASDLKGYKDGDTIVLQVSFDEEVKVLGNVTLSLNVGSAQFTGDLDTLNTTHEFSYDVTSGDNGALETTGFETDVDNRIVDDAGNLVDEANFPLTVAGVYMDTQAPTVTILNGTDEDITDDNADAYPVRGTCDESGDLVISLNGTDLPVQSITCVSNLWSVTISAVDTPPGSVEMTATLTDALGHGSSVSNSVMVTRKLAPFKFYQLNSVVTAPNHTCLVQKNKEVWCWGAEGTDQGYLLGNQGTGSDFPTPALEEGSNLAGVVQVSASKEITCVLTDGGKVKCVGKESLLGTGATGTSHVNTFTMVKDSAGTGELSNIVQISSSVEHSCALDTAGSVWCWGSASTGNLPEQVQTGPAASPIRLTGVIQVTTGRNHSCALTFGGEVKCWGKAEHGALGNGQSDTDAPRAVDVLDTGSGNDLLGEIVQVSAGDQYTCALTSGGEVRCWGKGNLGQLGNNGTTPHKSPGGCPEPRRECPTWGNFKDFYGL